jgi:hypothetical protein
MKPITFKGEGWDMEQTFPTNENLENLPTGISNEIKYQNFIKLQNVRVDIEISSAFLTKSCFVSIEDYLFIERAFRDIDLYSQAKDKLENLFKAFENIHNACIKQTKTLKQYRLRELILQAISVSKNFEITLAYSTKKSPRIIFALVMKTYLSY